jgi:hypothetical protein
VAESSISQSFRAVSPTDVWNEELDTEPCGLYSIVGLEEIAELDSPFSIAPLHLKAWNTQSKSSATTVPPPSRVRSSASLHAVSNRMDSHSEPESAIIPKAQPLPELVEKQHRILELEAEVRRLKNTIQALQTQLYQSEKKLDIQQELLQFLTPEEE